MSRKKNGQSTNIEVRRCAIYTRKSTARGLEQEFNTLDAQHEACAAYVERQPGWEIIAERYDDGGFTGANLERPAFQRLEADIEAGKIDIVVVYKVDRLSRSLLDFAKVMDRFNQAGTAFVSVTQNFSTADAMGRLTLNMLMSFAEFEREMIAERTKDKIAAARRKGKWTGGTVPIGYKAIDKKLVVDEVEAPIIREIFDLYEQHRSALCVAKLLNEKGRRTKRHRAKNRRVKESNPWTKDAVLRVLKNPVYAGLMPYGDERHEGEHEGIIDRTRFHHAQMMLTDHEARSLKLGRNPNYILRGVIRCDLCGKAMTPASQNLRENQPFFDKMLGLEEVRVNGRALKNWPLLADSVFSKCEELYNTDHNTLLHGDLCLSNILYDMNSGIVRLLDPRGRWGEDLHGDIKYDMAKLRHSISGGYDFIVNDLYRVNYTDGAIEYTLYSGKDHRRLETYFDQKLAERFDVDQIRLIEGLLFISMLPYHSNDQNRQLIMFARALELLNGCEK